jgi:hypothetical protein
MSGYLTWGLVMIRKSLLPGGGGEVDSAPVTIVALSPVIPKSKVTAGENGTEQKRQMQIGARNSEFLILLFLWYWDLNSGPHVC